MTTIVGLVDRGRVYLGGDSAGTDAYGHQQIRVDRKVFRSGSYLMGFTTSYRMGQLLCNALRSPEPSVPDDLLPAFMATFFVNAVRECLKDGGYGKSGPEGEVGGSFLVGVRGRLFRIESDYQVGQTVDGYDAIGSGSHALGSLASTVGVDPMQRVLQALAVAEKFNAGVRRPFVVLRDAQYRGIEAVEQAQVAA